SCWRYNIKRAGGALLSVALYPLLMRLGMDYLMANVLLVMVLTPANYLLGHFWTFTTGSGPTRAVSGRGHLGSQATVTGTRFWPTKGSWRPIGRPHRYCHHYPGDDCPKSPIASPGGTVQMTGLVPGHAVSRRRTLTGPSPHRRSLATPSR